MKSVVASAVLLVLAATVVQAVDWSNYGNARFGYRIDIPPGFSAVTEAANGDGGISNSHDGSAELRVWGGYTIEGDFQAEVRRRIEQDVANGWHVTYQKQHPAWASWSGTKGDRIFYERAIPACDRAAAYFRLEYDTDRKEAFDPIVRRLVRSLESGTC